MDVQRRLIVAVYCCELVIGFGHVDVHPVRFHARELRKSCRVVVGINVNVQAVLTEAVIGERDRREKGGVCAATEITTAIVYKC